MQVPADRLEKLERFREAGLDPFPPASRLQGRLTVARVEERFDPDAEEKAVVTVAGRVGALRDHGNSLFLDVRDDTGRIQVYVQKKAVGPELFALLKTGLDLGDHVAAGGRYERTRKGEATVFAQDVELLTKSLAVPPKEHFGLADTETRYRRRYVDLIANRDSFERFRRRSMIVREARAFLEARDFLEVETPMLHAIAGGAAARPFTTHHNTLDMDLFLRIAPELHLKRLLVGGFERVFEIGRNFRNEGISPRHNPEFTMLEAYWAYARMEDWLVATEELLAHLARTHGVHEVPGQGGEAEALPDHVLPWGDLRLDLSRPFARASYGDLMATHADVDIHDRESVLAAAKRQRLDVEGRSLGGIIDDLFGELVEEHLVNPTFVTDFPVELSPLAKPRRDDPRVADRFELFVAGMEVANAFSELNDPQVQLERFEAQVASRDPELPGEVDHDYVTALQYGMPPAAGIGIGIDRLVMLLSGAETIRDVILFPLLRPAPRGDVSCEGQGEDAPDAGPLASDASPAPGA